MPIASLNNIDLFSFQFQESSYSSEIRGVSSKFKHLRYKSKNSLFLYFYSIYLGFCSAVLTAYLPCINLLGMNLVFKNSFLDFSYFFHFQLWWQTDVLSEADAPDPPTGRFLFFFVPLSAHLLWFH